MLKKTITYKDLDGNEVTEDFYFGISKPELVKLAVSEEGGMETYLRRIVAARDSKEIINWFERIIRLAVGRRSSDGKSLDKSEAISNGFINSDAWTVLFDEMLERGGAVGAEMVKQIMPKALVEQIEAENVELPNNEEAPPWIRENREPTKAELQSMTPEQMREAFLRKVKDN